MGGGVDPVMVMVMVIFSALVDPVSAREQAESARTCTSSATAGSIHTGRSGPLYTLGVRLILSGQTELTDPFARNIDSCMELGCGEDWPPPMAALWELRLPCGGRLRSFVRLFGVVAVCALTTVRHVRVILLCLM